MVVTKGLAETRTLLTNISWQTFKVMLMEMGSQRPNRIAYESGTVEIMTPLMPHENSNRVIEGFVVVMCEELGLEIKRTGSLTLTRDDLERGGEPDSSYYIQNESSVRDRENIDLAIDPPPDLVLEVEYSRSAIDKLTLYASMGIPELWRFNGSLLRIYTLADQQYTEVEFSPTFNPIPVKEIPRFLQQTKTKGENAITRDFRGWVKQQIFDRN
ncbi:MAG: Uma2 family endonuclease [Pleurocapsa sp. MO_226.B13]|nr:Uma2 family endonuclease [Pleurocapsa sp. MO_226.B13]